MLLAYWWVRWLRDKYIEDLRAEHVARWTFAPGEVALIPWCSTCGAANHYALIDHIEPADPLAFAHVRLVCKRGMRKRVATLYLARALQPLPKKVLSRLSKWNVEVQPAVTSGDVE
jgi:hypothetical protein